MRETFAGRGPAAHRDAISATAGAMFYTANHVPTIAEGVAKAQAMLADGSVERWLAIHEEANYAE